MMKRTTISLLSALVTLCVSAQTYQLDPGHTLIEFNVERFMVGEVTGKFKEFSGEVLLNDSDEITKVQVSIATPSLDTDLEVRDGHLKSPIWLDAENYNEIAFESTGFKKVGSEKIIQGELTIKGQTNEVAFPYEMQGPFKDPTGAVTIGLSGDLVINRQDYGIQFSKTMDNGALFIGNEVRIRIRALAALPR